MSKFDLMTAEEKEEYFQPNTILKVITGSTSYGLNTPESDVDMKSIVNLPVYDLFSMGEEFTTTVSSDPDHEYHSLKKFLSLAQTQNPTVLEIISGLDQFVVQSSQVGDYLRKNKSMFLSNGIVNSFGGYAKQQLLRIKNGLGVATIDDNIVHLRETLDRVMDTFNEHYPTYGEGKLTVTSVGVDDQGRADISLNVNYDKLELRQLAGMTSELTNASKNFNKMGARNKKTTDKLGKHAMNLIRLLIVGAKAMRTGELEVYQGHNRDLLLDLRNLKYTWDEVFEMVAEYDFEFQEARKHSVLPDFVDKQEIDRMYRRLSIKWYGV